MDNIKLNDGYEIPQLGFGTYKLKDPIECERCVLEAIKVGYRMIDTAQAYENEEAVGRAIKKCGIPREKLFITTKISHVNFEDPEPSIEESMKKLQLDYIDLVLLHWPYGNYYKAWRALEKYQKLGKIRSIGVSNFDPARFVDLVNFNKVRPSVNQIETNVLCQRHFEREWMDKYNTVVEGYAPLGQGKRDEVLNNAVVLEMAKKYNKTQAQICIKYLLQLGYVVIPKSAHKERIIENFDVFDFEISAEDMQKIRDIDQKTPLAGTSEDPVRADYVTGGTHPIFQRK